MLLRGLDNMGRNDLEEAVKSKSRDADVLPKIESRAIS